MLTHKSIDIYKFNSLSILRWTFPNIYYLCSHNVQISQKWQSKFGQKLISLIYDLLHQQSCEFSMIIFHLYTPNLDAKKRVSTFSFFSNKFWITYFWRFFFFRSKYALNTCQSISMKKWITHCYKKMGTLLCSSLLEMCWRILKLIV